MRGRRDHGIGSDEAESREYGDKFGHRQRQELSSLLETGPLLQTLVPQSSSSEIFNTKELGIEVEQGLRR